MEKDVLPKIQIEMVGGGGGGREKNQKTFEQCSIKLQSFFQYFEV